MSDEEFEELDLGETVYDDDGNELGTIRGFDDAGFYVTMREGYEALSVEHARTGHEFGEGYLMWRCSECGEMGELDDELPEECPNCGAPKEDLYYWTED
nr:hypothetical protein [Candidatus Halobonum tyrrellensis]